MVFSDGCQRFHSKVRQEGTERGVRSDRRDGKMKGAGKECDGKKEGKEMKVRKEQREGINGRSDACGWS